ncbi:Flp pilus assembly complex ATPase component TadA [Candidatus Berkelbacteria bacterium]|nr:Flp pilus assembly complex ATPase component TadA [Candidatus Berkelbacteria bacterium]
MINAPSDPTQLSQQTAAQTAAKQLGLSVRSITAHTVTEAARALISEKLVREYRVIPLTVDMASQQLEVGIADPSLLSKPAPAFLRTLKDQGYHLQLVIVTPADFERALGAYQTTEYGVRKTENGSATNAPQSVLSNDRTQSQLPDTPQPETESVPIQDSQRQSTDPTPAPEPVPASVHSPIVPKVSLTGKSIPQATLEHFPADVARKYQMVVFEVSPDGTQASVAAVNPADRRVREILKFVSDRNRIQIALFHTTKEDLEQALTGYRSPAPSSVPEPQSPVSRVIPPPVSPVILQRASADTVKSTVVAGAPSGLSGPISTVATPATPLIKAGRVNQTLSPGEYQAAVTRNSTRPVPYQPSPIDHQDLHPTDSNSETPMPVLTSDDERNIDAMLGGTLTEPTQLEEVVKSGLVPRIVGAILSLAVSQKASDVHIEASRAYVRIRFRVDGELKEIIRVPTQLLAPLVSRIKIIAKLKIDESRVPQDGRFDVQVAGHEIDLRVSTLPTVFGEKVVMRILDKSTGIKTLEELGIGGTNLTRLREAISNPYGIILVTGPTGSGKTSTLYAVLSELNRESVNIVTLEDPVEYQLEGINQTQVRPTIGFSFADGLRSILRQDPNIVMVGEIRDRETAGLATQAALTGHLVLSTLHTNDASGAIPRMLDMGVEPFLLASSIKAVVGQRLVRKLREESKQPLPVAPEIQAEVKAELDRGKAPEVIAAAAAPLQFQGPGDPATGYAGRIGIYEVLAMSDALSELTLKKAAAAKLAETAAAEGMVSMRQDGILKALTGLTSLDEVLEATGEE